MVRFLIEHGADLNLVAESGSCTPLQCAAAKRKLPFAKFLLKLGADINGPPGRHGSTIHYALMSRNESMIRFFLDNGVEVVDTENQSCLCKALLYGKKDLLPELLERGAEVNQRQSGNTALGFAFKEEDEETVQFLLQHGAAFSDVGTDVLLRAVRKRSLEDIKKLLDGGMDPNGHLINQTVLGVSGLLSFWSLLGIKMISQNYLSLMCISLFSLTA